MNALLTRFLHTVHADYFMEFPLWSTADGQVVGEFIKVRLSSQFEPACDGAGQSLGMLARLQAVAPGGEIMADEALTRLTRVSETPVVLDRFIRSLHLLNYLQAGYGGQGLILPVSALLLEAVSQEHGRVFRQIVDRLAGPAPRIGFLLPATYAAQPARLAALRANYARHGFATFLPTGQGAAVLQRLDDGC
ncbi:MULTISPECIES: hypothetical protein [Aquitalea]|uniref:Uncharacterized protein n=1 Tax=Aquitalea magnusonii TaxID=332411 RepID=A0A318JR47_9NEIS|nr:MULTISPECIES: hypothetical protein [Aquitalea]PXX50986.1 hypothetical protein DFR38_10141 [Aquitalea magnusonii]